MADDTRKNGKETGERKKPMPPVEYRFKPGNPGRPKGSRNKLGEAFLQAMHDDFMDHGPAVIERVRIEKPDAYLKVIASILPKDLNLNINPMDDVSDDELIERLRELDSAIRPFLDTQGAIGSGEGDRAATAH
jgi:hypothetical protein